MTCHGPHSMFLKSCHLRNTCKRGWDISEPFRAFDLIPKFSCSPPTSLRRYLSASWCGKKLELISPQDIASPILPMIGLPLVALPHVINSSLTLSLLTDLIPRLSHSNPAIRKKSVVVLYRFALVYPDTLRPAWPKIKDMLMDENEDSSVTAAVINVVCELGWRRPEDFLSLAPRLFSLLVDSGNNWMAIKIIKLVSASYLCLDLKTTDSCSLQLLLHWSLALSRSCCSLWQILYVLLQRCLCFMNASMASYMVASSKAQRVSAKEME